MPEPTEILFTPDDNLAGFRLKTFEIFNWGTFDEKVWEVRLDGQNCLITGDIGSGKSTLVDALITLLVPPHRITYNKAAGADRRERSSLSYVLGHYKSERTESLGKGQKVSLRDANRYSVILGVFHNAANGRMATLAQVFWMKDATSKFPARFHVFCPHALSIQSDFNQFGDDISKLRNRLRKNKDIEIYEDFPQYGNRFRTFFGIDSDQTLSLFHQAVSLKSVGNLTEFVRNHMLVPSDIMTDVDAMIESFDNLNQIHEEFLKAKEQVKVLQPLVEILKKHEEAAQTTATLKACIDALNCWFALANLKHLDAQRLTLGEDLLHKETDIKRKEEECDEHRKNERDLELNIEQNGGARIKELTGLIDKKQKECEQRERRARQYGEHVKSLGKVPAKSLDDFVRQRSEFTVLQETLSKEKKTVQDDLNEAGATIAQKQREYKELRENISSLETRISKIDDEQIAMRQDLCRTLSLDEKEMPFAGELIQVRENELAWEGAAERVLRDFGLSLLVPDVYYRKVAEYVDQTDLKGKLVYFRVDHGDGSSKVNSPPGPDSLVHKLQIKQETPFHGWMEREMLRRFDLVCCTKQEQFHREAQAVTEKGQVKIRGERHEKDDRYDINNKGRYVLGWSNIAKKEALKESAGIKEKEIVAIKGQIDALKERQGLYNSQSNTVSILIDTFSDFNEIDYGSIVRDIERLRSERTELETTNEILKKLSEQLEETKEKLTKAKKDLSHLTEECGAIKAGITSNDAQRQAAKNELLNLTEEKERHFGLLDTMYVEQFGEQQVTSKREHDFRLSLHKEMQNKLEEAGGFEVDVQKRMNEYKNRWRQETLDIDVDMEAGPYYRKMLDDLITDGLPALERDFKERLEKKTGDEVAFFFTKLKGEKQKVLNRIKAINVSLTQVDYNPGRYIKLVEHELTKSEDDDVGKFRTDLSICMGRKPEEGGAGVFAADADRFTETRFNNIKKMIDKLREDKQWAEKVTDVRNWFVFAASERYRNGDGEHEHYADSDGKSGGQKEKLAYTVLAVSLAHQFGIEPGKVQPHSFRFAILDEAFGRGSDDSAEYAMELFKQLNLQMLVVTPRQKLEVIDPYVSNLVMVTSKDTQDGKIRSSLRNVTFAERIELRKEDQRSQLRITQASMN